MVLARRVIMSCSVGVSSTVGDGDIGCDSSGTSASNSGVASDGETRITPAAGTSEAEAAP